MKESAFFRLLQTPVDDKGETLAGRIAALNETGQAEETFTLAPDAFGQIPGSPFAYWVSDAVISLFAICGALENRERNVRSGLKTGDDARFVRAWWEVNPSHIANSRLSGILDAMWVPLAKGGAFAPLYSDVHLVVNWGARQAISETKWSDLGREDYYFRLGLTWPLRTTSDFGVRVLPRGCTFTNKGPSVFVHGDRQNELLPLLSVMNSLIFRGLIKLQMGAADAAARSYEVGVVQRTPLPPLDDSVVRQRLAALAHEAHDLQRERDRAAETTHVFGLPGLALYRDSATLLEAGLRLEREAEDRRARLGEIQAEIDQTVFDLYGLDDEEQAAVRAEMGVDDAVAVDNDEDEGEVTPPEDLPARAQNLLMWCVGVAFGRWDVRLALEPSLLTPLGGPFDPLSRCAPGALVDADGLPLASADELPDDYPLPIAWDGILVDDPTHPSDIVARARAVLKLLWGGQADAIEQEACDILGVPNLRAYFRDPRQGFFAFHLKRYSKSRRKAPIYWLLQSERRNYAVWLYCHRLTRHSLLVAGRDYADAKIALESGRLAELRQGLEALEGGARRRREREIERQESVADEVTSFRNTLDEIALHRPPCDLNDGALISLAPLGELVPWKEAQRMWERLTAGEYPWSAMSQQMRARNLIKNR